MGKWRERERGREKQLERKGEVLRIQKEGESKVETKK